MSDDPTKPPRKDVVPTTFRPLPDAAARPDHAFGATPDHIGPYRIFERIDQGRGGMGEVYRAEQRSPIRREVAIKLIKLGMDTRLVIARFEAERQALALMEHPHIAKVFDADADATGRPYFVMEYVKGQPITEYADANHLTIAERIELFGQVCQAIQHAHHKGIIHRDLKPGNVLVTTQDGKPFAKVIDFGIAKATAQRLTDKTLYTQHEQFVGTPQYMSPEQAQGSIDIDTRTDVYSLGVMLYELLTGTTPFAAASLRDAAVEQMKKMISEIDPPKPSTRLSTSAQLLPSLAAQRRIEPKRLGTIMRGELDWIVMMALEKDRARRYDSPLSLANDLQRYLAGQPIEAAPPNWTYLARKFVTRYRLPVAAALTLGTILIAATVAISALALRLNAQVKEAQAARHEAETSQAQEQAQRTEAQTQRAAADSAARRAEHAAARSQAQYLFDQKRLDQALSSAAQAYNLRGSWEDGLLINQIVNEARRNWDLELRVPLKNRAIASALVDTEAGSWLVVSTGTELVKYDLRTGAEVARQATTSPVTRLMTFRGTQPLLIAIANGRISTISLGDLSTVNTADLGTLHVIGANTSAAELLVTLSNDDAVVYSSQLAQLERIPWPADAKRTGNRTLSKIAISPNGRWVVVGSVTYVNDCLILDRTTHQTMLQPIGTNQLFFSDNSTLFGNVAGANYNGVVMLSWTLSAGDLGGSTPNGALDSAHTGHAVFLAENMIAGEIGFGFVPPGGLRAEDATTVVERYSSVIGHTMPLSCAFLSWTGQHAILASDDALFVLRRRDNNYGGWYTNGFNATVGSDNFYQLTQTPDGLQVRCESSDPSRPVSTHVFPTLWTPEGSEDSGADDSPALQTWASGVAVSGDQRTLAVRFQSLRRFKSVEAEQIAVYPQLDPVTAKYSGSKPVVFDVTHWEKSARIATNDYGKRILALSPDGAFLFAGSREPDHVFGEIYRTSDGSHVRDFAGSSLGRFIAFGPRTRWIVDTSSDENAIRLISWTTGEVERSFPIDGKPTSLCLNSDGTQAVVSIDNRRIDRIDLATGKRVASLDSTIRPAAWSARDDLFVGYAADESSRSTQSVVAADGKSGQTRLFLQQGMFYNSAASFSVDGQSLLYEQIGCRPSFVRSLSPEAADRMLLTDQRSSGDSFPVADAPAMRGADAPAVDAPAAETLVGADATASLVKLLSDNFGKRVTFRARVVEARPTMDHLALSIILASPNGPLLFISQNAKPAIDAAFGGDVAKAWRGRTLSIDGEIGKYGGRSDPFRGRYQVRIATADQVTVLNDDGSPDTHWASSTTAPSSQPSTQP